MYMEKLNLNKILDTLLLLFLRLKIYLLLDSMSKKKVNAYVPLKNNYRTSLFFNEIIRNISQSK